MRIDSQLAFTPVGSNQSLIAGAGVSIASTNVIDLLGQGVGTAPTNIIGNVSLFGEDAGIGRYRPEIEVIIGTACTTGTSATLNIAVQASADTAVTYQPASWVTLVETGPIAVGSLTANSIAARLTLPPAFPANLEPRYLRLLYQVPAGTDFTAGTVASAFMTTVRDDQSNKFAAKNFTVA